MTTAGHSIQVQSSITGHVHPLDPLSPIEIESAVAILRAERELGSRVKFETVELKGASQGQRARS